MHKFTLKLSTLMFIICSLVSCASDAEKKNDGESRKRSFDIEGETDLLIQNDSTEPLSVSIDNWYYLPRSSQQIDSIVNSGDSLLFTIKSQTTKYFNLDIDTSKYRLFTSPGKRLKVIIDGSLGEIRFEKDYKSINEFLKSRSVYSDWAPRGYLQMNGNAVEIIDGNDSITALQKEQVQSQNSLPEWYVDYETSRLDYVNAQAQLGALIYRKKMMGSQEAIPEGILESVLDGIELENEQFAGDYLYMSLLADYLIFKSNPQLETPIPGSRKEWVDQDTKRIRGAKKYFSNSAIRELYLTRYFTSVIERSSHFFKEEWLDEIEYEPYKQLLNDLLSQSRMKLHGESLPFFKLPDTDSTLYEPKDFLGKVVLINIWATWCRPCYNEFPHENHLVSKFSEEPVQILNICIDSPWEKWQEVLAHNDLKTLNLFANSQWSENINVDFESSGLPHSVLVDHEGKVIWNDCPRPSSGLDEHITEALEKIKETNK